jgi:hypothetical protein
MLIWNRELQDHFHALTGFSQATIPFDGAASLWIRRCVTGKLPSQFKPGRPLRPRRTGFVTIKDETSLSRRIIE